MNEKLKRVEVVAAVLIHNELVLACQRGYGEFKDMWEFPGGKNVKHWVECALLAFFFISSSKSMV